MSLEASGTRSASLVGTVEASSSAAFSARPDRSSHTGEALTSIPGPKDRTSSRPDGPSAFRQFETLHPFHDGNGRIGRFLVVLHLLDAGVLTEHALTVSPWFKARRADYDDRLLRVSTVGGGDSWTRFFADGLTASAGAAERQLTDLLAVSRELKRRVRLGGLRAENAVLLVDFCLQQPIFTVRQVQRQLQVTYPRASGLVGQLVGLGVLRRYDEGVYDREFTAPEVLAVLLR